MAEQTIADAKAEYERIAAIRVAMGQRFATLDTNGKAAFLPELQMQDAASSAAYATYLGFVQTDVAARGWAVQGTLATCPTCAVRTHVENVATHGCDPRVLRTAQAPHPQAPHPQAPRPASPVRSSGTCRYCGEDSSFGGYFCPMSRDGEQPHRYS